MNIRDETQAYPYTQGNYATQNARLGGNPITSYLGKPNNPVDMQYLAKDGLNYRNYQEWKAYEDQTSPFLRSYVTMQILDRNEFYVSEKYGLPIRNINQTQFNIEEIEMVNVVLPDEPEEGIAPVIRQKKRQRTLQSNRKGIMVELEHGFAHTPEGKRNFDLQTQVITNSTLLTIFLGVIEALMNCKAREMAYAMAHAKTASLTPKQVIQMQARDAFVLQKNKQTASGLLYRKAKIMKERASVEPNALYVPTGGEPYFHGAINDPDLDSTISGSGAYERRMDDPWTAKNSFAKVKLCVVNVSDPRTSGGYDLDPLIRERIFGGFNHAKDHFTHNIPIYKSYSSSWRDIYINNFDKDKFDKISLYEMVKGCRLFRDDGKIIDSGNGTIFQDCNTLGDIKAKYFTHNVIKILNNEKSPSTYGNLGADIGASGNLIFGHHGEMETANAAHAENLELLLGDDLDNYKKMYDKVSNNDAYSADNFATYVNSNAKDPETLKTNVSGPLAKIEPLAETTRVVKNALSTMSEEPKQLDSFSPDIHMTDDVLDGNKKIFLEVGGEIQNVSKKKFIWTH